MMSIAARTGVCKLHRHVRVCVCEQMEMIHRLNSGHTTQRKKREKILYPPSFPAEMYTQNSSGRHGDDELLLPSAFDLFVATAGWKKTFFFIENRYSIHNRAGYNILPGNKNKNDGQISSATVLL